MGQEFLIVRCYSCETFQVDIKKKATQWVCKICGEKQSLKQVFWTGPSGKEGREHVQRLNVLRGQAEATKVALLLLLNEDGQKANSTAVGFSAKSSEFDALSVGNGHFQAQGLNSQTDGNKSSKWAKYLTPEDCDM